MDNLAKVSSSFQWAYRIERKNNGNHYPTVLVIITKLKVIDLDALDNCKDEMSKAGIDELDRLKHIGGKFGCQRWLTDDLWETISYSVTFIDNSRDAHPVFFQPMIEGHLDTDTLGFIERVLDSRDLESFGDFISRIEAMGMVEVRPIHENLCFVTRKDHPNFWVTQE